jgi:hypothetical protein
MGRTAASDPVTMLTSMLYPGMASTRRPGRDEPTATEELVRDMVEAAYRPYLALLEAWQEQAGATGSWWGGGAWGQAQPTARRRHRRRCGETDDCHCQCCVVDADLVVHSRLGERRIVPVTLENPGRREREVRLELSEFTTRGGSPADISGQLLTDAEFTLAGCEEREIVIAVSVQQQEREERERDRLLDVDDCVVGYADLRMAGCDNRPIRIAVSVLPRDCDAYHVRCERHCC